MVTRDVPETLARLGNGWALTASTVLPAPRKRVANKPLDLTPAPLAASKLASTRAGAGQRPPVLPGNGMTSEPENGMVEVLRHPNLVFADQARELLEEDGVHVYMREESVGGSGLGVSGVLSSFPGMEYVLFVPEASLAKARDILAAMPTDSQTSAEALPWVHDEGQLAPPASLVGLRPLLITLACALGAVGYFCLIALLIFQGQTYVAHATRVGAHYFPFLFIRNAADLIRLYGYWTMRKWSVYLCAILIVVGVSESLLTRTLIKPFGITMEIIILGLGILYYKRMK